ncbi:unnamed protein product [Notodromas monacha]|uniref:Ubiquitin-like domain-containing protein n=1 Tax=Notodromas monacha TaxID=399045 RepID=A0A7R9BJ10_9CRUS|nr:unnamed protein product [Notodromas monacha]CAG0914832.1 unnamed protein product [Notodromas monacha]
MGWPISSGDETPETTLSSSSCEDDDVGDMKWELSNESDCGDENAVTISVHPTTGGEFTIQVTITDSVDTLKKVVSHRLKVPKERISLLYRDRLLREGTLNDNLVVEGAKIILLPSVEAGLLTMRPEQSIMQALESLNESQVSDFLSGKAPLNLTMRLGDYMMIIQLQLSPNSGSSTTSGSNLIQRKSSPEARQAGAKPKARLVNEELPLELGEVCKPNQECCDCVKDACVSSGKEPESSGANSSDANEGTGETNGLADASWNLTQTLHQFLTEVFRTATSGRCCVPQQRKKSGASGCPKVQKNGSPDSCKPSSVRCPVPAQATRAFQDEASSSAASEPKNLESGKRDECHKPSSSTSSASDPVVNHQAVIDKLRHHGFGVYSGTFAGTLNPSLQDTQGKPWPGIATIIHILNDLLCANPQLSSFCDHSKRKSGDHEDRAAPTPAKRVKLDPSVSKESTEGRFPGPEQMAIENAITRSKVEALRQSLSARKSRKALRKGGLFPHCKDHSVTDTDPFLTGENVKS